jgi:hypothetical protein
VNPIQELLLASGPIDPADEGLMAFGQFIGVWDMDVQLWNEHGDVLFEGPGEWSFGWILDGRAIQDVLQADPPDRFPAPPGERRIGTTLRYRDPATGRWRVVWLGAVTGTFLCLTGEARDDGTLVITGTEDDGSALEWMFSDITETSFTWTGKRRHAGRDWFVEQLMTARRRA